MRWLLLILLIAVLALAVVLGVRTASYSSPQVSVPPADRVAVDEVGAASRLAGALRFRTVSEQRDAPAATEEFFALHEYLATAYPLAHQAMERETVGALSLLYTWRGSDPELQPLLLTGHLDVVPVSQGTEGQWTHPPFGGVTADGYVWGRGALDDKASVVGLLEAVERLVAEGFQPRRTVLLAFGHDEELGGTHGAAAMVRLLGERGVRPAMVLDEGGLIADGLLQGFSQPVALVAVAEKGFVSLELTASGTGGHSSVPPPQTAVGIVSAAIVRLESNPFPARLDGVTLQMFDRLGPAMPLEARVALANQWLFRPVIRRRLLSDPATAAMIRTTTAATMFEGSQKDNVLPERARAVVNFRIRPGESIETVRERVGRTIRDDRVRVTVRDGFGTEPSPVSPTDRPEYELLNRTIREVFPDVLVAPFLSVGATDARHYAELTPNVYRFLPIRVGREEFAGVHGTNERVRISDFANAIRFYRRLIVTAAGS